MSESQTSSSKWFSKLHFNWRRNMPMIMQSEASECGIACLAMIANYFGQNLLLRQLRRAMPAGQQGMNLQHIITFAQSLGFSARALKLELDDLSYLSKPAILHWNFSHFVVITKMSKNYIYISDPAVGERRLSLASASKSFTGVALELLPNQNFSKSPRSQVLSLWDFVKPIRGIKRQLCILIAISLLLQLFSLAAPFYMQTVVDKVLLASSHSMLNVLALGFGLLLVIESLTQWLREVVVLRFSNLFNMHISSSVLAHLLSLPLSYFQRRHMGDIVSRFGSLQPVRDILTQGLVTALIDGILSIATLIMMFLYSPQLATIVLAIVSLYALARWMLFYPVKRLNQQILHSDAQQQSFFMQSIRAVRTIKLANTSANTQAKWLNFFVDNENQRIRLGQWNIGFSIVNKLLFGIENIVVVYVAATLVMASQFSVGMLFAFISYKTRFLSSCAMLIEKWIEYKILAVHLGRVEDIVHQASEQETSAHAFLDSSAQAAIIDTRQTHLSGAQLLLEKVGFRYHPEDVFLFNDLNLRVESGQVVAIIGATGCGKTSLLHCILGLEPASSGKIILNGATLSPQTRQQFRVAAVMQNDQLLSGSILDNIAHFHENIDINQVIKAARLACIDTDIMAMTMQYQTLIGDMGDSLSGGQKQRILLARALYQQTDLLILDEATSHLDIATEAKVCANLKTLNTTIIMVAHRPHTIATAEKIYTLSSAGLIEVSHPTDSLSTKTKL